MKRKIKWGIIGLGKIAEKFAEDLRLVGEAELYAVASRSIEKSKEFGKKFNTMQCYGSYLDLVKDPDVEVVYIATPHTFHYENTLLCLNNGKSVLCEKPFAMKREEVEEMIALAKEKDLFLMEALWTRFSPSFQKALSLVKEGVIGEIKSVFADFGFKAPFNPEGRLFNKKLGGGALMDVGIYPIFLAYSFLGMPININADVYFGTTHIDESESITFYYKDGVYARLDASIRNDTPIEAHINGSEGRITIHSRWHEPTDVTLFKNRNEPIPFRITRESHGYNYEAQEVSTLLLEGKKESSLMSHQDSINLITLLDEVREKGNIAY